MSYRRGFQRFYLVVVAIWIGCVLFAVVYREWHPEAIFNGGWQFTGITATEELRTSWPSIAAVCVIPGAFGYLVIFYLVPWIRQGFRSTQD